MEREALATGGGKPLAALDDSRRPHKMPSKRKRDHRVPLSARAMEILQEPRELAGSSAFVFPGVRGDVISRGLKRLGVGAVPHGFRSSFRTWASEHGAVLREIAEAALAHKEPNKAIAAYDRFDYLDQRRTLMEEWGGYLTIVV